MLADAELKRQSLLSASRAEVEVATDTRPGWRPKPHRKPSKCWQRPEQGREGVHCACVLVCCRRGEIQHWRRMHLHVADERDQRPPMAPLSRSCRAGGTRWTQKKSSSTTCAQATCPPTERCSSWSATATTTSCPRTSLIWAYEKPCSLLRDANSQVPARTCSSSAPLGAPP